MNSQTNTVKISNQVTKVFFKDKVRILIRKLTNSRSKYKKQNKF